MKIITAPKINKYTARLSCNRVKQVNDNPFGGGKTENSLNLLLRGLGNVGGKGEGGRHTTLHTPIKYLAKQVKSADIFVGVQNTTQEHQIIFFILTC